MGNAHVVLIVPLGELGTGPSNELPGLGGILGGPRPDAGLPSHGHVGGGPVYPPGHPSAGLPVGPQHPSNRPPNVPPNVVWPPSNPARPDQGLPAWQPSGNRPTHPISPPAAGTKPVDPAQGLPAGSSLVLVYNAESGWQGAVVDQSGTTKPIAPPEVAPK